ncbi:MAG: SH3 domain-containing protein [Anaerolineales bacterium]
MKPKPAKLSVFLALTFLLAACGRGQAAPTPTASPSATPDLCAPEYLPAVIQGVHSVMRAFDDASALASNAPRENLLPVISELQRLRRQSEDLQVPACLTALKQAQLTHMNTVIQTLMAFLGGADQAAVNQGIAMARQQHDQYIIEMAHVLGMTVVAPASATFGAVNPAPTREGGESAPTGTETATPSVAMATNPGPSGVNLRNAPDLNAPEVGILAVQITTMALGKTADNLWILVEIPEQPGQTAWVYSTLVQLSVPIDQLTVVTP